MIEKVLALLGSLRFWIVTLTAVTSYLNGVDFQTVLNIWAAAVVGLGTADSVAERLAGK